MNELCIYILVRASQVMLVVKKKNPPANAGEVRVTGSIRGSGRSPGEAHGQPTPVLLPGKFHGQRNPMGGLQSIRLPRVRHG